MFIILTTLPACKNKNHSSNNIKISHESAEELMDRLYHQKSGFGISSEESEFIKEKGGAPTYGEIKYESAEQLFNDLKLTSRDVLYDLGSGVGKLIVQAYLTTPVKKSVGIELAQSRSNQAQEVQKIITKEHRRKGAVLEFRHQSIVEADLHDATVIYMCSTCYSEELMQQIVTMLCKLKKGLRVITLKELPANTCFQLIKTYHLPMTWSKSSPVHVYLLK